MTTKNTTIDAARVAGQLPNYRIYDRTGGGVTEDIYAESLEDAIEQGREWIEAGDWSGCDREDEDGGKTYRTIELDCCVREIVRIPDLRSIEALPGVYEVSLHNVLGAYRVTIDAEEREAVLAGVRASLQPVRVEHLGTDDDGAHYIITTGIPAPTMIDEDATLAGDEHDCSGKYSDDLPECENLEALSKQHVEVTPNDGGQRQSPPEKTL